MTPTLHGRRVRLRPMQADDITDTHLGWLHDAEVVRYSNQRFVQHTPQSCLAYLRSFDASPNHYLSVRLADSEQAVGTLTAYVNPHHGTADIGILMGERSVWGQGLGLEAFGLLADWLAVQPGMRKLSCGTLSCNRAMLKLAQRAGFTREAVRAAQELVDGEPADIVYFARFVHAAAA